MEKACLVTGKPGPLFGEIVRLAAGRERQTLVTRSGHMNPGDGSEESAATVSWNRRSPLSARSVVLHAVNTFGRLDEAIAIYSPAQDPSPFHESSIVGIEDRVDAEVKGYLYILREIVAQFVRQGRGRLVLVLREPPDVTGSPLETVGVGSFVAIAESLQRIYQSDALSVQRFRSTSEEAVGYAHFILDRMERPGGRRNRRWHTFDPRSRLFSRS